MKNRRREASGGRNWAKNVTAVCFSTAICGAKRLLTRVLQTCNRSVSYGRANVSLPMNNPIHRLRQIAWIEGVSFLVLLFIAMPMKYFLKMPMAVKAVGWVHGVLFIALCIVLIRVMIVAKWPLSRGAMVFIAALLPFGPFVIDRRMTNYEQELQQKR